MMLSMMVVRPAPLRPTSETTSPSSTVSDTPCRICAGPRKVLMPSTSSSTWCSFALQADSGAPSRMLATSSFALICVRRPVGKKPAFVHHHDAVGIAEHDIHVVLDDDGGHRPGAHDRGHRVHDLRSCRACSPRWSARRERAASAAAHRRRRHRAACARPAPALPPAPPLHALETELAEHIQRLVADVLVMIGQRRDLHGLALAREDRQRDIVEHG